MNYAIEEIEGIGWEDLEAEEREACPPLLLLGDDTALLEQGFETLARLLDSALPVKVILLDGHGRLASGPEPALVAMAHRRAFVLAASPAHPEHLARGLTDALAWPGPALVHLHAPDHFMIYAGPWFAAAAKLVLSSLQLAVLRLGGVRLVWTMHDLVNHEGLHPTLDRWCRRITALLSDAVIVHCQAARERARSEVGVSAGKLSVIPHGHYIGRYPASGDRRAARQALGLPDPALVHPPRQPRALVAGDDHRDLDQVEISVHVDGLAAREERLQDLPGDARGLAVEPGAQDLDLLAPAGERLRRRRVRHRRAARAAA